jgi:pimeloyl-ACP methyl ester carboxylesterase
VPVATETWKEQTLECAGLTLRYLEGGSGQALVTLHHSTGSPGWLPVHEELSKSAQVYLPDMPGFGQSTRPDWARAPRDIAILLIQAFDKLGLDRVAIAGFGFGGFVAAELATMNARRLSHLVLVGAAGLQPEEGEILDEMMVDFDQYVKAGFRSDELYAEVFGDEVTPEMKQLWDFSREMTARLTWKPYMFNRRLAPLLKEVDVPALLIWGEQDQVVPVICGRQYSQALPNARLEVSPGAGHLVEYEEPGRVSGLISDFINS